MTESALSPAVPSRRQRARALSCLFLSGSVLALSVEVLLPPPPDTSTLGVSVPILAAGLLAAILWLGADRMPDWTIPIAVAIGSALISADLY
jgi:hypothetical protein